MVRSSTVDVVADIPEVDIYFLIDATPTLAEEITVLQAEILNIISDIRLSFPNAQFGLGLYREYPLAPLAAAHSQAPYHHILDFTDDEALVQTAVSTLNTVAERDERIRLQPRRSTRSRAVSVSVTWFPIAAPARTRRTPTSAIPAFAMAPCTWS